MGSHLTYALPDEEPTRSLESGMWLGKYRLIEEIGRGGMGVVWSAEETKAARKVVLKFVPSDVQKFGDAVEQLKESFQKIHELHHQHICPVLTLDEEQGVGYFHVMKWLDGETLDQYVKRTVGRGQPLPLDKVLQILHPVAEALDYAHGKRIIHRDIKPSNIFIELDETKTIQGVQIIDFGLASEIRSVLSRASQGKVKFDTSGTRPYMAPEQWRARPQLAATDQYALAVTAYELLAGHLPFDIDDEWMLRMAVMQDPPEPIPTMPEHVNAALLTALAKDAGQRFETCTEFIAALGGTVAHRVPNRAPGVSRGPQPAAPGVESLMKRGHLFLEDSDWKQAKEYFDRVLDIDPEYAPAYIGKLCAELKMPSEECLGIYEKPIADFGNFKKAVRFADDEYRTKIEGYDEKIRERLRQEEYDRLVAEKIWASEKDIPGLAKKFRAMDGYKDTAALADECDKHYHILKERREEQERIDRERLQREEEERERREAEERERQYRRLGEEAKTASNAEDWGKLAAQLRAMNGYRNTAVLASQCDARAFKRGGMVLSIKGVEFPFRWCPAGTFMMGSPKSEEGRGTDETQHQVTLSRGFWMLTTPVTQGMWKSAMGNNPSDWKSVKLPVEQVSWEHCQKFVKQLNDLNVAPSGYRFSLPTEAQWEYACRAGTTTPFNFGRVLNGNKANCNGNFPYGTSTKGRYLEKTCEVGLYPANAWGLFDMHGNVLEWCLDWYGAYPSGSVTDPVGASSLATRLAVLRGGSWNNTARVCRSAHRGGLDPSYTRKGVGVRISLVPHQV